MNILEIQNCTICYQNGRPAVSDASLSVSEGEIVSIVGESGSGKTTLIRAILGLLPAGGRITGGSILFNGRDLVKMREQELQDIRGREIAMIFQDPMTALNPIETVGSQIAEAIGLHEKLSKAEVQKRAVDMLEMVGIPGERYGEYPHQFSGGMKQRVVIAMALACRPELLLADEPTGALDSRSSDELLRLFGELNRGGQTIVMVTHSVRAASTAGRVLFIKDGEVFHQLYRGGRSEEQFYQEISGTLTLLATGGMEQ